MVNGIQGYFQKIHDNCADNIPVTDDDVPALGRSLGNRFEKCNRSALRLPHRFAAGNSRRRTSSVEALPGRIRFQLVEARASPFTEVELDDLRCDHDFDVARTRERLLRECAERGVPVFEGYGLSEAAPFVAVLDEENAALKTGSVGRPALFVDIRVVTADGVDRTPGEIGELLVRGPNVMAGYWNATDGSRRVNDAHDWLHTGDAACIDADGFLFIVGRMADAYDVAGTAVHPGTAERVLLTHEAVVEACVIGGAEGATAHVVLGPIASAGVEAELRALLETLPVHARPTAITYVASLPKNANGKILRRRLSPPPQHEGERV